MLSGNVSDKKKLKPLSARAFCFNLYSFVTKSIGIYLISARDKTNHQNLFPSCKIY